MGEYAHTIDAKGRVILPADFRQELGVSFVITKGLDKCLFLYGQQAWEELAAKLRALPLAKPEARASCVFSSRGRHARVRQAGAFPRAGESARVCGHHAAPVGRADGRGQPHRGLEQGPVEPLQRRGRAGCDGHRGVAGRARHLKQETKQEIKIDRWGQETWSFIISASCGRRQSGVS